MIIHIPDQSIPFCFPQAFTAWERITFYVILIDLLTCIRVQDNAITGVPDDRNVVLHMDQAGMVLIELDIIFRALFTFNTVFKNVYIFAGDILAVSLRLLIIQFKGIHNRGKRRRGSLSFQKRKQFFTTEA